MSTKRLLGAAAAGVWIIVRLIAGSGCTSGNPVAGDGPAGTMTDADGNVYRTVKIGTQVWMAENLRTTKYADGSLISLDTSATTWNNAVVPEYCFCNNTTDPDSIRKYGALYNWYAVSPANPKPIAPAGWHVPSDAEWDTLQNRLIAQGRNWDGTTTGNKIAKSLAAKTDWGTFTTEGTIGCDLTKNNGSGFSALPAGCRTDNGDFSLQVLHGYWWSAAPGDASAAWYRALHYGHDYLDRGSYSGRYLSCGFSVRLVRDAPR